MYTVMVLETLYSRTDSYGIDRRVVNQQCKNEAKILVSLEDQVQIELQLLLPHALMLPAACLGASKLSAIGLNQGSSLILFLNAPA